MTQNSPSIQEYKKAVEDMLNTLDRVTHSLQPIMSFANAHGIKYTGPTWVEDYTTLLKLTQRTPKE